MKRKVYVHSWNGYAAASTVAVDDHKDDPIRQSALERIAKKAGVKPKDIENEVKWNERREVDF